MLWKGTLELLIKISTAISAPSTTSESKDEGKNYSDIWNIKNNNDSNYWFLKQGEKCQLYKSIEGTENKITIQISHKSWADTAVEVAEEALQLDFPEDKIVKMFEVADDLVVRERLVLESGCIVLTFETGFGNNTMPILLIETDLDMQMFDWSKKVRIQKYVTKCSLFQGLLYSTI